MAAMSGSRVILRGADILSRVHGPRLILDGSFLRVVDHEDINGRFPRFQLEPQLLFQRLEDGEAAGAVGERPQGGEGGSIVTKGWTSVSIAETSLFLTQ